MTGPGNIGGVPSKQPTEATDAGQAANVGDAPNINWAKATLDDLRMAFIVGMGPEKGQKMFNQFQMMIFQTCLSQMKAVEPKKHDDEQNR
jgi:hypothetical protein